MSRFGFLLLAGVGFGFLTFGCGEKDLSNDPNSTGGSVPTGGIPSNGGSTTIPESDAGTQTGIDSASGPVYTNDIDLFLKKYCTSCHGVGGDSPQLDTYATAKAAAVRSDDSIQAGRMPLGTKPAAAEKTRFADWVKAGAPL